MSSEDLNNINRKHADLEKHLHFACLQFFLYSMEMRICPEVRAMSGECDVYQEYLSNCKMQALETKLGLWKEAGICLFEYQRSFMGSVIC